MAHPSHGPAQGLSLQVRAMQSQVEEGSKNCHESGHWVLLHVTAVHTGLRQPEGEHHEEQEQLAWQRGQSGGAADRRGRGRGRRSRRCRTGQRGGRQVRGHLVLVRNRVVRLGQHTTISTGRGSARSASVRTTAATTASSWLGRRTAAPPWLSTETTTTAGTERTVGRPSRARCSATAVATSSCRSAQPKTHTTSARHLHGGGPT